MAELQHDRILGETVTQTFAFDGVAPLEAAAFVSIRLWPNRPNQSSGQILRESLNPAACLAVDTLEASGGKVVPDRGGALLVSFADVFNSILAARRLQWAFEGLSEASEFAGVAVAAVVHSSQDLPSGVTDAAIAGPLENALPGQVLLSEAMCRALDDLHVMSCESTNDPAFRALNWKQTGAGSDSAADEQTLFRNIKELGFSNARASAKQASDALESLTATEVAGLPFDSRLDSRLDSRFGGFPVSRLLAPLRELFRQSPWLVWAGSGFAVLCAWGLIAMALHRAPRAIPAAVPSAPVQSKSAQPAPVQPAPAGTSGAPVQKSPVASAAPAPPGEHTGKPKAAAVKAAGADPAKARPAKEATELAKASGSTEYCGIPVDRILKRADDSMNAGRFDEAGRDYAFVLKCDRNNSRAAIGLERLNEAKRLQRR